MMSLIEVKNLNLKRPSGFELKDISFSLEPGDCLCLVGASGSGKTTLLECLLHKRFIRSGSLDVKIPDADIALIPQLNYFKSKTGSSDFYYQQRFESAFSDDTVTVMEDILKENDAQPSLIIETLNRLGISKLQHENLLKLSSGENKRLQIAKALLKNPKVFVLDSPFMGLDQNSQHLLSEIFAELKAQKSILIISCDVLSIPEIGTKVLELDHGKCSYFGDIKGFKPVTVKSPLNLNAAPPQIGQPLIELVNVNVRYDDRSILKDFSWKIFAGEKWLLRGHNGAGKSTILSLINADNPQAYANHIYLFGKKRGSGESIWDIKKQIGFCSPEFHLYFDLNISVFDALVSGFFDTIGSRKVISDLQQSETEYWLNLLELTEFKDYPLRKLPFSLQRLLLIGRAMIKKPELLILDEPCQGLDSSQISKVKEIVSLMPKTKTLIYVSHNDFDVPEIINLKLEIIEGQILVSNNIKDH